MKWTAMALASVLGVATAQAHENEGYEKTEAAEAARKAPALAAALKEAKVSLANGLEAAEKEGTPVSGKFEVTGGKLQLSITTVKGDKYFEVIVDPRSGKVEKVEPINGGEDLKVARRQAEAIGKAKNSLRDALTKAESAHSGYKAVSIAAEIEKGAPEAEVSLLRGTESKHVDEKL